MIPLRLKLIAAAAVLLLVMAGAWKLEHDARIKAQQAAKAAEMQATLNAEAVKTVDRYHTETVRVYRQAEQSNEAIRNAPNANQPLPADVLAAWRDGINRMRQPPQSADDPGA